MVMHLKIVELKVRSLGCVIYGGLIAAAKMKLRYVCYLGMMLGIGFWLYPLLGKAL